MNTAKRIIAVLMLAVMALLVVGCGSDDSIVGKWELDIKASLGQEAYDEMKAMGVDMGISMEFTKDGKAILVTSVMGESETEEATYTIEDNKIVIDGEGVEYSLDGGKLTLKSPEGDMVFKKAK